MPEAPQSLLKDSKIDIRARVAKKLGTTRPDSPRLRDELSTGNQYAAPKFLAAADAYDLENGVDALM